MNGTQRDTEANPNPTSRRAGSQSARQAAVEAVAHQRQLEVRRRAAAELAERLEELAVAALAGGRDQVRPLLDQRVEVLKQAERLADELRTAAARAQRLKAQLLN